MPGNNKHILIIGAGLTGLSVAYHLKRDYTLFEKEAAPGGTASSDVVKGFVFDKTGHLLHFKTEYIRTLLYALRNGSDLIRHRRSSWIFSKGTYTRYPFQVNTYRLPPPVIQECLLKMATARVDTPKAKKSLHFKDWILNNFGEGVARHFMFPYNRKLWKTPLHKIDIDWVDKFIPKANLQQAIMGAVSDFTKNFGYSRIFYYPEAGGIQRIADSFMRQLDTDKVRFKKAVARIDLEGRRVIFNGGERLSFDRLVSTIPLPELANIVEGLPLAIIDKLKQLKYVSVFNLNLGIKRKTAPDKHWVYFPEKKYIFYRVGCSSNFSNELAPEGMSSLYTEVSYSPLPHGERVRVRGKRSFLLYGRRYSEAQLKRHIIKDLKRVKMLFDEDDIITQKTYDIRYAYPLHDKQRSALVRDIKDFFSQHNVYSIGRYGSWRYMTMEDCIVEGKETAELINNQ